METLNIRPYKIQESTAQRKIYSPKYIYQNKKDENL